MADTNYSSGDDYIVEFLGYRFSFGATDFEGRVVAAAVKLGVVETAEGKGTTFRLRLPLAESSLDAMREVAARGV